VLCDSEADIIYIKSVDTSGMPSLKILDYTVRNDTPQKAEISPQTDFVTKDELLTIKEEISALKAKFERIDNTADNRKDVNSAMTVMEELMTTIMVVNPPLYKSVMRRVTK